LGVSVIVLPALVFQSDVAMLFGLLTSETTATLFADLMHKTAIAAIVASVLCLVLNVRRAPWVIVEYALLVATALIAAPLIYFVVYFCGLHSPRHFLLTADQLRLTPVQGLRAALPIMAATLLLSALGAIALYMCTSTFEATTLQLVFIGLAALTVPHMILTAVFKSVHH
jgi:Brp/Blh family beta-carotene 15,15'-monooxygenase